MLLDDLTLRHPWRRSCLRHHQREHDPRISRLEGCTDFHDLYGEWSVLHVVDDGDDGCRGGTLTWLVWELTPFLVLKNHVFIICFAWKGSGRQEWRYAKTCSEQSLVSPARRYRDIFQNWQFNLIKYYIFNHVSRYDMIYVIYVSPLKTNEHPLKIDGWKMIHFPFVARSLVSGTFVHFGGSPESCWDFWTDCWVNLCVSSQILCRTLVFARLPISSNIRKRRKTAQTKQKETNFSTSFWVHESMNKKKKTLAKKSYLFKTPQKIVAKIGRFPISCKAPPEFDPRYRECRERCWRSGFFVNRPLVGSVFFFVALVRQTQNW